MKVVDNCVQVVGIILFSYQRDIMLFFALAVSGV